MRILHLDENHPLLLNALEKAGFQNSLAYSTPKSEIESILKDYHGLVVRSRFPIDASFLTKGIQLKFIARVGAGVENIDQEAAKKMGIELFAAPLGNANAVGEHALGMLLSLMNKLRLAHQSIQAGEWLRESHRGEELEGKTVAVPLNTMADFAFKSYMNALNVDMSTMTIVDQAPPDGAKSLADGAVDMACIFGGNSSKAAGEVGTPIMTSAQKVEAGIGSFDVISVTEKFATENPELLRTFLDVTDEANAAWKASDAQLAKVAADAGMSVPDVTSQMAGMIFMSEEEQLAKYFGKDGIAASAAAALGTLFSDSSDGLTIAKTIDGSFLD